MGLSWQQGPLSTGAIGRFLVREPLPKRLLYVEPLRRRMRVRFGGVCIADSEHALVLFAWYTVRAGEHRAPRAAWQHIELPAHARELQMRVAFAWHAMDAFYE